MNNSTRPYQSKRLITKQQEESVERTILEQVIKNKMTISNLKDVVARVINHMELNAVLEMEDPRN